MDTADTELWAPFQQRVALWLTQDGGQSEESEPVRRLAQTAAALRMATDTEARAVAARHAVLWQDHFTASLEGLGAEVRGPAAERLRRLVRDHSAEARGTAAAPSVLAGQNLRVQADHSSVAAGMVNGDIHLSFPSAPDPARG
ncbi:hypothetical protein [Streptomyces sp. BpilaLS-43]|uniref:hypothetical protein n=1 Tax=Streptomyces sp. BpilaLS-43 TaxID=1839778 RepID=UPI0021092DB9|nr:hypothetical protein [Streptomyces sp. BpilaLS-43]